MKKKLVPIMALVLAALLLFSGCSAHGKTLIEAGKEEISVNVFQLYLSRMKGTLASAGCDVNDEEFWATYVDIDNMTQNQYFTNQVFEGLKQIAAALILYHELGLELDAAEEDEIDAWIDELIAEVGDGSKSQLNSVLSSYGANITVLRDAAIIEAKIAQLKDHLYGEDGSRISDTVKEQFYQNTYYRGYQMLIANYYHDHDKDSDGRTVYYKVNEDGSLIKDSDGKLVIAYDETATAVTVEGKTAYYKYGGIAYDTENGTAKTDTDGNAVRDTENRDVIYVLESGRIAYDKENGVETDDLDENGDKIWRKWVVAYDSENGKPNYKYDSKGENKIAYYTDEEMAKRLLVANEIAEDCKGNTALFLEYMKEFSDNQSFNESYAPNGMYFSAGTYTTDTIFYTFSTELAKLEIGELAILDSDSGYYIIMRSELDEKAWSVEENSRWFGTMTGLVVEYMLQNKVKDEGYLDRVEVNTELKETVDITMVAANNYY
ncbi:MAG: hypothetical protein IJX39_08900 [Clostridia bacterium]|nr:hypothetical protein [Clostridia bacterium]